MTSSSNLSDKNRVLAPELLVMNGEKIGAGGEVRRDWFAELLVVIAKV